MKVFRYAGEGSEAEYTAIVMAETFEQAVELLLKQPDLLRIFSDEWGCKFLKDNGYLDLKDYLVSGEKDWLTEPAGTFTMYRSRWELLNEDLSTPTVIFSEDRLWD